MHLMIGGAYQGKTEFAKKRFGFSEKDIFYCTQDAVDFSFPCIAGIQEYVYGCVCRGEDALAVFRENRDKWSNSVLILRDISGGIVPMDKTDRAWREAAGRLCQYLAGEAQQVSRIFCGLEDRLK